ncbi:DNA polymerase delta catalytic subunit [Pseudoloma neurophilia]|uniref:DNA polymerase n=1 Tax=Pseudoloma neurophilia TaxID=146866 RepID=A0A0R0M1P4_9MICR|nr:DNA polymerase delta catalytic subunit [Pseudoloma neurophilia]
MRFFQTNITSTTLTEGDISTSHVVIDCIDSEMSKYQLMVTDYFPYIYVEIKNTALEIVNFLETRNVTVEKYRQSEKMNIFGYQESNLKLIKCFFRSVTLLNSAKKALENQFTVYNGNIPFLVQFMVDLDIKGMTYIDVKKMSDTFERKEKNNKVGVNFSSALEEPEKSTSDENLTLISSPLAGTPLGIKKYISYTDINNVDDNSLPSFKILSFDIETTNRENKFPDAAFDPIIQIGNTIKIGEAKVQIIFCVGQTASIDNAEVRWFKTEKEMLQAWLKYIFILDYDIIMGYNINFFDFPYVMQRAKQFGLGPCLCRQYLDRTEDAKLFNKINTELQTAKTTSQNSLMSQTAITISEIEKLHKNEKDFDFIYHSIEDRLKACKSCKALKKDDNIEFTSRLVIDMIQVIKKSHSLRSYTLNNVSQQILNNQKEDIPYYLINSLFKGDDKTRRRIAVYCLKDTLLPLLIFEKLVVLLTGTEMARVLGVPINWHFNRGISIKIFSLILRQAKKHNYVIPIVKSESEGYTGAVVIDPERGYYDEPIAVLDFASLYPSIIIAHNLCYTTLVLAKDKHRFTEKEASKTPVGTMFIKKSKKDGLLPVILQGLLKKRKEVKKMMADEKDPLLKSLMNARQNAFKTAANSLYGFTGSSISKLPCLDIGQTITGYGREMIVLTKNHIESNFNPEKGYKFQAKIIYGDTDSVMIKFIGNDINTDFVFDIASKMAKSASSIFLNPIKLEFEKIYQPYLLMNKKRYAGVIETREQVPAPLDENEDEAKRVKKMITITKRRIDTKGIETVRRDNCKLVKHLIEESLDLLLMKRDPEKAKKFVKDTIRDLYLDKIDMSMLVISKTISKKSYSAKQAHVELADKMQKRDNVVAEIGDRIAFVIIDKGPKVNAYEKSEDPSYALQHNLALDIKYYIEQQISNPVQRLFEPLMDNVNELFVGEHTKTRVKSGTIAGPMAKFVQKSEMCLSCKTRGAILCKSCEPKFFEIYTEKMEDLRKNEQIFNKCWRECQRCIQSVCSEVICANKDCPIFFKRAKARKNLDEITNDVKKLESLSW